MSIRPFHHQRPLVSAALAYGLGVWAGVSFPWRPIPAAVGLGAAAVSVLLLPRCGRKRTAGVMACFLFLGQLLGGWAAHPPLPPEGVYRVSAVLSADVELRENGTAAAYLEQAELTGDRPFSVDKLYWTYTPEGDSPFLPREGDRVSFSAKLYHPQGRVNPYGFDLRMYLLERGVKAGVSGCGAPEIAAHPGRGLASVLYHLRETLASRVRQLFGADSALPEALLLGRRSQLPEETARGFSDAGAAHLLAVSGLHVGLLAGLLMIPLRRLLPPKKRVTALGAFLLLYCALLNFSAPVARASLLMLFAAGRRIVRRAPDPLTTLSAAFLLILLLRPLDLFSPSFQLSFCAVLGIVAFSGRLPVPQRPPLLKAAAEQWRTTVSATAGVALPTIQLFHRFSLVGLLANPFLCAFFSVLLPVYLLILVVGCVHLPSGVFLAGFVNPVTRGLVQAVAWLGRLPFAVVRTPSLPWYCTAAVVAALALMTRYFLFSRRVKVLLACGLLALSFGVRVLTACRDVQYIQLAMGQADSALLLDGGETAVIDAGAYGGDTASYLLATGRQADHLILTHLHVDHCLGVFQLLEQEVPIGTVYLPEGSQEQAVDPQCLRLLEELRARRVPIRFLSAGDEIRLPRSTLTAVWPVRGAVRPGQDANRFCLALLCDLDGVTLLTVSDLPGAYEHYAARPADILKVAHHGSKASTGGSFLDAVRPRIALIPASRASAALPHGDTLARLAERKIRVYHTGLTGAVTVTARDGRAAVLPYLNEKDEP